MDVYEQAYGTKEIGGEEDWGFEMCGWRKQDGKAQCGDVWYGTPLDGKGGGGRRV